MTGKLDTKLLRDLRRMKGQVTAVALVMGCGLTMLIMARSLIHSLETTRAEYYRSHRFADLFVHLKRAPKSVESRLATLPGVVAVQTGISVQATLDLPGMDEPATGVVRSVPDQGDPELNRLYLRSGRMIAGPGRGEVLVGEAFAQANQLRAGDTIAMVLNGKRQELRMVGIVLSPEFIFAARPGSALPDDRTYGTFWMRNEELANAFDLGGAFNHAALVLDPNANERAVIAAMDRLLVPYGGRGAYGRADHPSHIRVSDEIRVLVTLAFGFPLVFLSVGAFMTNAVLSRLLNLQREQIAILKAFGFTNGQVVAHYLKFALVMVAFGTMAGGLGGVVLGHRIVDMYKIFFRFPELGFHLDRQAPLLALAVSALAAVAGVFHTVRRAALLPPAEAMRPEPPADYRPAILERTGVGAWLSHTFRIAVRNLERRRAQALFTAAGLSLATGILIVPNSFRDSVSSLLGFEWDVLQRQDVSLGLVEPSQAPTRHLLEHLPGVRSVEAFRHAPARIRHGHRRRQIGIQGISRTGLHTRAVDARFRQIALPDQGLVVSSKLAEVLGARIGDELTLEFLEGRRQVRQVRLMGLSEDLAGIAAYMERTSLNRLLGEGDVMTGASVTIDGNRRAEFLRTLKGMPRIGWIAIKETLRSSFRKTTAASIGLIQTIYMVFATVVAFGVVYNNASISLAERSRELATLRVIGFSRREVGSVLVTELVLIAMLAVPFGLLLGTGFATGILKQVNTETVRLPLVLTLANYSFALAVVAVASVVSGLVVLRRLDHLDLVGALRAPE